MLFSTVLNFGTSIMHFLFKLIVEFIYRLILPNTVESLDIVAPDPFLPSKEISNGWVPVETINVLNEEALKKLEVNEL